MDNYNENNKTVTNTPALVSMILGIISVVLCWVPIIGIVVAIVALVLSVKGLNNVKVVNKGKGFSIAGISCGSVGIVLNIIYTIIWISVFAFTKNVYEDLKNEAYDYNNRYNTLDSNYNNSYNKRNILNNYTYNYDFDL